MESPDTGYTAAGSRLPLADRMKAATKALHSTAERTGVVSDILKGRIERERYALYLRNLHVIYAALERAPSAAAPQSLSALLTEDVRRAGAMAADLADMCGGGAWTELPILASARSYLAHIERLHATQPSALIGHIYVRYLGDMNGGQVLERLLKRALDLPPVAYRFYRFPAIDDLSAFCREYRARFNRLGLTPAQDRKIIETAVKGFEFNIALSNEVLSHELT